MRFHQIERILIFLFALNAAVPFADALEMATFSKALFTGLWIAGWFIPLSLMGTKKFRRFINGLILADFGGMILYVIIGMHPVMAIIQFTMVLLGLKLCSRDSSADYKQILMLSFLLMVAATVTGYDFAFGLHLFLFIILILPTASVVYLHSQVELRFAKKKVEQLKQVLNSKRVLPPRLLWTSLLMSVPLVLVTGLIFVLIPRMGMGFGAGSFFSRYAAGFGDHVTIGEVTDAAEQDTIFARIFTEHYRGRAMTQKLRAAVYTHYDNNAWKRSVRGFSPLHGYGDRFYLAPTDRSTRSETFVITQKPMSPPFVFIPDGTHYIQPRDRYLQRWRRHRMFTMTEEGVVRYRDRGAGIEFTAVTGSQRIASSETPGHSNTLQMPNWHPEDIARIAQLAARIASQTDTAQKVHQIEQYLKNNFRYSKEPSTASVNKDAILYFLFNSHTGICEHFATATVLLLRSQGIPARFITGFQGGRWNEVGQYHVVTAKEAHAWAEAYVNGHWITIDATPSAGRQTDAGTQSMFSLQMMLDALELAWYDYVIDFSLETQVGIAQSIRAQFPSGGKLSTTNSSTKTAMLLIGISLLFYLLVRFRPRTLRRQYTDRRTRSSIQLYQKLERYITKKTGRKRSPSQTPAEYIHDVSHLIGSGEQIVRDIQDEYYETRFGEKSLSPEEHRKLKHRIQEITFK